MSALKKIGLAAAALPAIGMAGGGIWNLLEMLSNENFSRLDKALWTGACLGMAWFALSWWLFLFHSMRTDNFSWALLTQPRPEDPDTRAVWRWGRQTIYAIVIGMGSILLEALIQMSASETVK